MNRFGIVKMARGGLALVLEPTTTWDDFPAYAEKWTRRLNAKSSSRAILTFDECTAEIALSGRTFWITYDDFQNSFQLEPKDSRYNNVVIQLQAELRRARDDASRSWVSSPAGPATVNPLLPNKAQAGAAEPAAPEAAARIRDTARANLEAVLRIDPARLSIGDTGFSVTEPAHRN